MKRDGAFANAVDKITEVAGEEVKQNILAGQSGISKQNLIEIAKKEPEEIKEVLQNPNSQKPDLKNLISKTEGNTIEVIIEPNVIKRGFRVNNSCKGTWCYYKSANNACVSQVPFEEVSITEINFKEEEPSVWVQVDEIIMDCPDGEYRSTNTCISPNDYFEVLFNNYNSNSDKRKLFNFLVKELEIFRPEPIKRKPPVKQAVISECVVISYAN